MDSAICAWPFTDCAAGVVRITFHDLGFYSLYVLSSSFADSVPNGQAVGCGLSHKLILVGLVITIDLDRIETKIVSRCGADMTDGYVGIVLGFQITLDRRVDAFTIADEDAHVLRDDSVDGVEGRGRKEVD